MAAGSGHGSCRQAHRVVNNVSFIAEDLGSLTPQVHKMLADSGLPGMKVLEFAFDPNSLSDYLPHRIGENSICYAGTHDNNTLRGWIDEESAETLCPLRANISA